MGWLAVFLPLGPATRTATVAAAATTDPNADHTTPPPAHATAGAKIATAPGAAARTVHTSSCLWADDDARSAASTAATARPSRSAAALGRSSASAAATARPSRSAAALGRSSGADDQGKAK